MLLDAIFVKENIVHVGAAFYLAGFLCRDQFLLRGLVICGVLVYLLYFFLAPAVPLWGGIFWSTVFIAVNAWAIGTIVADRTQFRMDDNDRRLFSLLQTLTPGEFRRLMRSGEWKVAAGPEVLTEENRPLSRLYYVLDGDITVEKSGRRIPLEPHTFIGEVAFLASRPASATVTVAPGARYVVWEAAALRRLQLRAPSLGMALAAALN